MSFVDFQEESHAIEMLTYIYIQIQRFPINLKVIIRLYDRCIS